MKQSSTIIGKDMRPYYKIERTFDTTKDQHGNMIMVREDKGWFGKPKGTSSSQRLTKDELISHWDNAKDEPITDEDKKWLLVKIVLKANLEQDDAGNYDTSSSHRGTIWKEASRVYWDADEAWTMMLQEKDWIISQVKEIIQQECEGLEKALWPVIVTPAYHIPRKDVTHKTQASQRTKIANGLRQHLSKRGKALPKKVQVNKPTKKTKKK
jgi:hypothetical protein